MGLGRILVFSHTLQNLRFKPTRTLKLTVLVLQHPWHVAEVRSLPLGDISSTQIIIHIGRQRSMVPDRPQSPARSPDFRQNLDFGPGIRVEDYLLMGFLGLDVFNLASL